MRNHKLKLMRILTLALVCLMISISASAVDIAISPRDNSPIDIVITGSSSAIDGKEAEASLRAYMSQAGIDLERVQFDAGSSVSISSSGSGAQEIVDTWTAFPDGKVGQSTIMDGSMMIGPLGGGPGGMYDPKLQDAEGDVEIDFTFQTTCVPYSPAVLLRWRRDPATRMYSGYVVGMSTPDHNHQYACMRMTMYIWRVESSTYPPMWIGMSGRNNPDPTAKVGLVAYRTTPYMADGIISNGLNGCSYRDNLYYAPKYNYHVTMKDGKIRFELDVQRMSNTMPPYPTDQSDTYVLEWDDPTPFTKGSIGFFSHNANAVGMPGALFKIEQVNDLIETVRSPNWRPDSHRFIIDGIVEPRVDLESEMQIGELTQRINADGAHYVGLGNELTITQQKAFVTHLTSAGIVLPLSSNTRYRDTAYWMEPIVNSSVPGVDTKYLKKDKNYNYDITEK